MDYDSVAEHYDQLRSDRIGVEDMLAVVRTFAHPPRVIDLGCGTGRPIAMHLAPVSRTYVGLDRASGMLSRFAINVPQARSVCAEMDDLDAIAGTWDLLFSWGSLCHLPAARQATVMRKASMMLDPGGLLVFTSGREAGSCTGSVGALTIHHVSLGLDGYTELAAAHGLRLISCVEGSGGSWVFTCRRSGSSAGNGVALSKCPKEVRKS